MGHHRTITVLLIVVVGLAASLFRALIPRHPPEPDDNLLAGPEFDRIVWEVTHNN